MVGMPFVAVTSRRTWQAPAAGLHFRNRNNAKPKRLMPEQQERARPGQKDEGGAANGSYYIEVEIAMVVLGKASFKLRR